MRVRNAPHTETRSFWKNSQVYVFVQPVRRTARAAGHKTRDSLHSQNTAREAQRPPRPHTTPAGAGGSDRRRLWGHDCSPRGDGNGPGRRHLRRRPERARRSQPYPARRPWRSRPYPRPTPPRRRAARRRQTGAQTGAQAGAEPAGQPAAAH